MLPPNKNIQWSLSTSVWVYEASCLLWALLKECKKSFWNADEKSHCEWWKYNSLLNQWKMHKIVQVIPDRKMPLLSTLAREAKARHRCLMSSWHSRTVSQADVQEKQRAVNSSISRSSSYCICWSSCFPDPPKRKTTCNLFPHKFGCIVLCPPGSRHVSTFLNAQKWEELSADLW